MIDESTHSREELIRSIRETNQQNMDRLNGRGSYRDSRYDSGSESSTTSSYFGLRCFISLCLMAAFLAFQNYDGKIFNHNGDQVIQAISADTKVNTVMNQFSAFIKSSKKGTDDSGSKLGETGESENESSATNERVSESTSESNSVSETNPPAETVPLAESLASDETAGVVNTAEPSETTGNTLTDGTAPVDETSMAE